MIIGTSCASPENTRPIVLIGAGGIVNDAHLPAYKIAGFPVEGIYDIDTAKARHTAAKFDIPQVYDDMSILLSRVPGNAIFDVAVPGSAILSVLKQLPKHSVVLMQKPMGEDYEMAKEILDVTRRMQMTAGVNFQLRYAPFVIAARNIIKEGWIGELCDIEVNVNVYTPWHLWDFLRATPRVEILYHSIHYIDLVRSFLGNPESIYAKTIGHPAMAELASVRSNIIMDYGNRVRANILTNHCHDFGLTHQQSYIKFEGMRGAIIAKLGVLINYPQGIPDSFEYVFLEKGKAPAWQTLDIAGSWFPHAFIGTMAQMMIAAEGDHPPEISVEDCIHTMACVEAAYQSSAAGGIRPV
ncbi:MAG TPA: Gfo/Idh/MocA family oxidoreductase [Puia sp.]|nr:Gfo/Idh/MocA family oxidoreductase [Puia sp.]